MLKVESPYRMSSGEHNDRWAALSVFPGRRDGYFVELGAADGFRCSACQMLERWRGWRGICVEPNPAFYGDLKRNRPGSPCVRACVTGRTGTVRFLEDEWLSRVVGESESRATQEVPSYSLADLLNEYDAPATVDYLVMDIEGCEKEVLSAYPFGQRQILAISTEGAAARHIRGRTVSSVPATASTRHGRGSRTSCTAR